MIGRLLTAATTGILVTLALLFGMGALIELGIGAETTPRERTKLVFVRAPKEEIVDQIEDRPPRIPDPIEPPPTPQPETFDTNPNGTALPYVPPAEPTRGNGLVFASFVSDGPLVTVVRVQPAYPPRAKAMGLEGYVIVEYTVLADGTTSEFRVVESTHSLFDKESIRAVKRFRYKPRVIDGTPVATPGVRSLFRFNMDEA